MLVVSFLFAIMSVCDKKKKKNDRSKCVICKAVEAKRNGDC